MKKLLLHTCCAPCLSGCYDQIADEFLPIIFWYNPNIEPKIEHDKRLETLLDYLKILGLDKNVDSLYNYEKENKKWHEFVHGLENEPEGGKRCNKCFTFRLDRTAIFASQQKSVFSTTLTVSPYKNAKVINSIGRKIAKSRNTPFLEKNFSDNNSYRKSLIESKKAGLYRQKYCGCKYSIIN